MIVAVIEVAKAIDVVIMFAVKDGVGDLGPSFWRKGYRAQFLDVHEVIGVGSNKALNSGR